MPASDHPTRIRTRSARFGKADTALLRPLCSTAAKSTISADVQKRLAASTRARVPLLYSLSFPLNANCQHSPSTRLSTRLQCSWAITQSLISGNQDVAFGVVNSGRNVPINGIKKIVGPTVCTYPARFQIDRTQSTPQFLREGNQKLSHVAKYQHFGL